MSRTVLLVASDLGAFNAAQILDFNSKAKDLCADDDGQHFAIVVDQESTLPGSPSSANPDTLAQEVYDDHFDTEANLFDLSDEVNGGSYEILLFSHPRKRLD